jgi:hypothetical protein
MTHYETRFSTAIIAVSLIVVQTAFASQELTPKQLVALIQASRQRYTSFDVQYRKTSYRSTKSKPNPELYEINDVVWRCQTLRSYVRRQCTNFEYLDGNKEPRQENQVRTCAFTPKWSKQLIESPKQDRARGRVIRGDDLKPELGLTVQDAMWGLFGQPWEKLAGKDATLTKDVNNNYYILEAKVFDNGTIISVTIDSAKGYLPIAFRFKQADGITPISCECSDFRMLDNGLWLPYKYVWSDSKNGYSMTYEVITAKVNIQLPDELLDFSFPQGTIVNDQIANLRYTVGKISPEDIPDTELLEFDELTGPKGNTKQSLRNDRVTVDDLVSPPPAEEASLRIAEQKGKELVSIAKQTQGKVDWQENSENGQKNRLFIIILVCTAIAGFLIAAMRASARLVKKRTG